MNFIDFDVYVQIPSPTTISFLSLSLSHSLFKTHVQTVNCYLKGAFNCFFSNQSDIIYYRFCSSGH